MVFTTENSTSTAPMGKWEAEEITKTIQGNFNNLGDMLEIARNRKAWKVLGYRDFEGYCNNEFGKSKARAYELIAEAAIAQSLKEADPSLRLPAQTNLKFLKELPIEQQIEAVKRSEWLAKESDKKKPDKSDLLIAIDEMEGCRSGDMRPSLEARGFIKGVEVATTRGVNIGSRGIIIKVDKTGDIHVELHAGGKIPLDAASCRILPANEKPKKRAWSGTTDIGDKVLIFSKGLENTIGTIKSRFTSEKMVGVDVNGDLLKLPYAELEVVEVEIDEPDQDSWLQNFIWNDFGAQWCYDSESKTITTVYKDLTLHPAEKGKGSPADWVRRWAKENIPNLVFDLLPLDQLSTLIKSRLITCGEEEEKGNLAESLITEIWKMTLPSECREKVKSLISSKADKAQGISFALTLHELLNGKKIQTRRFWQDDYARSFIRYYEKGIEIPALNKGRHRGGQEIGKIRLTEKPYQQMLSEMPVSDLDKEGGMCTTVQEFVDRFFEGQDKLVWVLDFEFIASDSASEVTLLKQRLEEAERVIGLLVECRQSDTVDTAIVDTVDTAIVDTVDTAIVDTVDTAIVDTVDTAIVDTVDTAIVDTVDTAKLQALTQWGKKLAESVARITASVTQHTSLDTPTVDTPIVDTATVDSVDTAEKLQQEIDHWRAKITDQLQQANYDVATTNQNMTSGLRARARKTDLEDRLSEIDTLQNLRIGQIVTERDWPGMTKTCPGGRGGILALGFIYDGIPKAWVKWSGVESPDIHRIRTLKTENDTSPVQPLDAPETSEYLVENTAKISAPGDTAAHTGFLVENNTSEVQPLDSPEASRFLLGNNTSTASDADTAAHTDVIELPTKAGLKVTFKLGDRVNTRYGCGTVYLIKPKKTARKSEFYVKRDNGVSMCFDFEQAASEVSLSVADTVTDTDIDAELKAKIEQQREKLKNAIAKDTKELGDATRGEVKKRLSKQIDRSYKSLLDLEAFEKIKDGQTVEKKIRVGAIGNIVKLDILKGGLPQVWVKWAEHENPESIDISALNLAPVISMPKSELPAKLQKQIKSARENITDWRDHAEEELLAAEEQNKSIFARKIESHNNQLAELDSFANLRIDQHVLESFSSRRGEILIMEVSNTGVPGLVIKWENGKTEPILFANIVPEQLNEH